MAKDIERHFTGGQDGPWFVETGRKKEAELFRRAAEEIKRLEGEVAKLQGKIDTELDPYRERLLIASEKYDEACHHIWNHAEKVRNAAKGLVTQIDKVASEMPQLEYENGYLK